MAALDQNHRRRAGQHQCGRQTNETTRFQPLLDRIGDLRDTVVTLDALHCQQDHVSYLAERGAHWIMTVKANQPTLHAQLAALPWQVVPQATRDTDRGHGQDLGDRGDLAAMLAGILRGVEDEDECVPERFRGLLERIVQRIAAGDYEGLSRDFSPYADDPLHDLGVWAREYPATFVPLPPEAWQYARAYYSEADDDWMIELDLWSAEEGRSDMTLEATIRESDGQVSLVITGLHVM